MESWLYIKKFVCKNNRSRSTAMFFFRKVVTVGFDLWTLYEELENDLYFRLRLAWLEVVKISA